MRGVLRITSARVPFRRAGLVFGATASLVDVRSLDGARLLALAREPLLSIEIGDGAGGFRPMPRFDAGMQADHAQMLIDSAIEELGPLDADTPIESPGDAGDDLRLQLQQQAELIERQNDDLATLRESTTDAEGIIKALRAEIATLKAPKPAKTAKAPAAKTD